MFSLCSFSKFLPENISRLNNPASQEDFYIINEHWTAILINKIRLLMCSNLQDKLVVSDTSRKGEKNLNMTWMLWTIDLAYIGIAKG